MNITININKEYNDFNFSVNEITKKLGLKNFYDPFHNKNFKYKTTISHTENLITIYNDNQSCIFNISMNKLHRKINVNSYPFIYDNKNYYINTFDTIVKFITDELGKQIRQ